VPLQLVRPQLELLKEPKSQRFLVDLRDEVLQPLEQPQFREQVP
jgi:hypothetical protein